MFLRVRVSFFASDPRSGAGGAGPGSRRDGGADRGLEHQGGSAVESRHTGSDYELLLLSVSLVVVVVVVAAVVAVVVHSSVRVTDGLHFCLPGRNLLDRLFPCQCSQTNMLRSKRLTHVYMYIYIYIYTYYTYIERERDTISIIIEWDPGF